MSKSDDSQPLKNIVVFVIYSAVFILMFILLAKRQIFRMKLRYDKNFDTGNVNLLPKAFVDSVDEKLAAAIKARHPPQLLPSLDEEVTDLWPETKVRMRALAIVDETFIKELEPLGDDIAKTPEEDILEWYERIAKKFSTQNISAQNFRTLVNAIHDCYVHARYMAEPFPTKNYHQLAENCKTALERLRKVAKRYPNSKKKSKSATAQAIGTAKNAFQAGATIFTTAIRGGSSKEEHQKLL